MTTKSLYAFIFFMIACLSTASFAEGSFDRLRCSGFGGGLMTMTLKDEDDVYKVKWTIGHAKIAQAFDVLRAVVDPSVPDRFLKTFDKVEVKFSLPVDACAFDSRDIGVFRCSSEEKVAITVDGFIGDDEENYETEAAPIFESSFGTGPTQNDFIEFSLRAVIDDADVSLRDAYGAERSSDGVHNSRPDCSADERDVIPARRP